MCADDVVCSGAAPLFFLDYVAVGRLDPEQVAELVGGVAAGCVEAGCALVGGETAEHPGLMEPATFDLAGFCVGVVERDELLDGSGRRAGDAIIGLPSSGLHANGYSLVRSLIAEWDLDLARPYQEQLMLTLGVAAAADAIAAEPEHGLATLGEVLLTPTTHLRRRAASRPDRAPGRRPRPPRARPHHRRRPARQRAAGAAGRTSALGSTRRRWPMPSVIRLIGALGGLDDDGAAGDVQRRDRHDRRGRARAPSPATVRGPGRGGDRGGGHRRGRSVADGGPRYVEGALAR